MNKHERVSSKQCDDAKVSIEYSNDMNDIYENIEECNTNIKAKNITQ